jgi:hypothetical protein
MVVAVEARIGAMVRAVVAVVAVAALVDGG